jgi:hypothetical protein
VMLLLIAFAFIGYQRRTHRPLIQSISAAKGKPSPTPVQAED